MWYFEYDALQLKYIYVLAKISELLDLNIGGLHMTLRPKEPVSLAILPKQPSNCTGMPEDKSIIG